MYDIREMRTRKLNQAIQKKVDTYGAEDLFNHQGAHALLVALKKAYDFQLMQVTEKWLVENCKNHQELLYAFRLFLQRAINKGRSTSTLEDFDCIVKNIDFSILYPIHHHLIGCVYTLGILEGIVKRIEIRSCAIPVKKGKGTITSIQQLPIYYLPVRKLIKDFNIYIKIYPKIPKEDGQWEAALITAIYSSIYNKTMPPSSLVLGGITKKGGITPIDIEKLHTLENKKNTIIMSTANKNNIHSSYLQSLDYIYINHIDEIISMLQELQQTKAHRRHRDFLCE